MKHTFFALSLLTLWPALSHAAQGREEITSVTEDRNAVYFQRPGYPDLLFFSPRTETIVQCDKLSDSTRTCTANLRRKVPDEAGFLAAHEDSPAWAMIYRQSRLQHFGVTATTECEVLAAPSDTHIVTLLKRSMQLQLRARGVTPVSADAPVCMYRFVLSGGTDADAERVLQGLETQAREGRLIRSPLQLPLAKGRPFGRALDQRLREKWGQASLEVTAPEAAFLMGVAAAELPELKSRIDAGTPDERSRFVSAALPALFSGSPSRLTLRSVPAADEAVSWLEPMDFDL